MEFNQFLLSLVKLDSATEASKGLGELLREKVKLEKGLANLERNIELSRIHANHQSHYDNDIARYIVIEILRLMESKNLFGIIVYLHKIACKIVPRLLWQI